jgi:hypothetical protein
MFAVFSAVAWLALRAGCSGGGLVVRVFPHFPPCYGYGGGVLEIGKKPAKAVQYAVENGRGSSSAFVCHAEHKRHLHFTRNDKCRFLIPTEASGVGMTATKRVRKVHNGRDGRAHTEGANGIQR